MNGWHPGRGEDKDVFECLLAVRFDRILNCDECLQLLTPLDRSSLLSGRGGAEDELPNDSDDGELLAELGISPGDAGINRLRHVRSSADKRAVEEIAGRTKCADFDQFQPLFDKVQLEITAGIVNRESVSECRKLHRVCSLLSEACAYSGEVVH